MLIMAEDDVVKGRVGWKYDLPSPINGQTIRVANLYLHTTNFIRQFYNICGIDLFLVILSTELIFIHFNFY
jgi:hypothetical protein